MSMSMHACAVAKYGGTSLYLVVPPGRPPPLPRMVRLACAFVPSPDGAHTVPIAVGAMGSPWGQWVRVSIVGADSIGLSTGT